MSTIDEDIAARLALCWLDVTGIKDTFAYPRGKPFNSNQTPAVEILVGPLIAPSHRTSDAVVLTRQFRSCLYAYPFAQGLETEAGAGNYKLTLPFLERGHLYFAAHPHLATNSQAPLAKVTATIQTTDAGPVGLTSPGGGQYWGAEFTHIITAHVAVTQVYLSGA